jgi:hypothetical protein
MSAFQSTSSSLSLLRTINLASTEGAETGLTAGAATGSSTSHEDGTDFDVSAGGASFSTRAPKTPGDDDANDEEAEDEEFSLDDVAIVTTLKG